MKTIFKINTATQQAATIKMKVVDDMLVKCGITYEQWINVLFETGCAFVEESISEYAFQISLLANKDFGFWDWWLILFIDDDETLLSTSSVKCIRSYMFEKRRLIKLYEVNRLFDHFLNTNRKLNQLHGKEI